MSGENSDLLQKLADAERTIGQWAIRVGNAEVEAANAAKRERAVRGELETARAAFGEADQYWRAAEAEVTRLRAVIAKAIDDLPEWSTGALKHLSPAEVMGDSVRMDLRRAVEED